MHYVGKIEESSAATPEVYREHSSGFRRATYVDRAMGSVHMGVGVSMLDSRGTIEAHVHSFEESFILLEGNVAVQIGDSSRELSPGDFGLIPTGVLHSWRNTGTSPARWLEIQAPQPRLEGYAKDTFFVANGPANGSAVKFGHFDESQLPRPGAASEMEGFNPTTGVAI